MPRDMRSTVYFERRLSRAASVVRDQPHGADVNMDAYASADDYIKSFIEEIEAMNDNAVVPASQPPQPPQPPQPTINTTTATTTATTLSKKRKRPSTIELEAKKPGWVPKPATDCPIMSWVDSGNVFAVQNPANAGRSLLKMQLYDGQEVIYMCGLYLDNDSGEYASVVDLIDKLENLWIDKATGVPKITGLTQTVAPSRNDCATTSPPQKKRAKSSRKKR